MKRSLIAIGIAGCCVVLGSYIVASYRNKKLDETNSNLLQNPAIESENIYNENFESVDLRNNIGNYIEEFYTINNEEKESNNKVLIK